VQNDITCFNSLTRKNNLCALVGTHKGLNHRKSGRLLHVSADIPRVNEDQETVTGSASSASRRPHPSESFATSSTTNSNKPIPLTSVL